MRDAPATLPVEPLWTQRAGGKMAANDDDTMISARAAQAAHEAIDQISARSSEAEERLRDASQRAAERTQDIVNDVSEYVTKNPLAAVGIAAAAGFVLGSLLRR